MHVNVYHDRQHRFRATARGHHIWLDQPFAEGGQDSGMDPTECWLAALGSSMGEAALQHLQHLQLAPTGLHLSLTTDAPPGPDASLGELRVHLVMTTPLTTQQRRSLHQALSQCHLLTLMKTPPKLTTEILTALASS
jgi:uncharacterized OsmC-like protein